MVSRGYCDSAVLRGNRRIWRWLLGRLGRAVSARRPSWASEVILRAAELGSVGLLTNGALVQMSAAQITPPEYSLQDENHVDMVSFGLFYQLTDLSIGSNEDPLAHT